MPRRKPKPVVAPISREQVREWLAALPENRLAVMPDGRTTRLVKATRGGGLANIAALTEDELKFVLRTVARNEFCGRVADTTVIELLIIAGEYRDATEMALLAELRSRPPLPLKSDGTERYYSQAHARLRKTLDWWATTIEAVQLCHGVKPSHCGNYLFRIVRQWREAAPTGVGEPLPRNKRGIARTFYDRGTPDGTGVSVMVRTDISAKSLTESYLTDYYPSV